MDAPLFAALSVLTGEVTGKGYRHHRTVECNRFLTLMGKSVPETQEVHRILDNDGTHKTALIRNGRRRFRRGTLHGTQALEAAIRESLQVYNEDPQPFTWTKGADDILNSLRSYGEGSSGVSR